MNMIRVGICLDDVHFARALSMGLARECRNMTFILLESVDGDGECDLILSSAPHDDQRVITMVRDETEENIYEDPPYRVYRYKESHRLVNDLLFIYFKITGQNLEFTGDAKCKVLVFASVSGGSGCTATAISVGQMLYKLYGCKCLYLNLCPIDDSKKYLPAAGQQSLLSLLYYLDTQKDFPLGTFLSHTQQIDYVHTNLINSYFDEIQVKLLTRLMKKIDELGTYPFLIVDMSNHFSRTNKQLLSRAFRIILLYQDRDRIPEQYFLKIIGEIKRIAKRTKLIKVKNFVEDDFEENENFLLISREKMQFHGNDRGLIDLSSAEHFQLETGAIARQIMEEGLE